MQVGVGQRMRAGGFPRKRESGTRRRVMEMQLVVAVACPLNLHFDFKLE
jgi:hypothetical protein